ncbi:uncharacterized protein LOC114762422 [Neltuma alba]|uniref:uncharacterized protein LOC114762422 n=1 Tax=Neltuma alba TaxID=207710 RepID=UPI0010A59D60|nr:uncharacterized protein LOC114762422 [Prosopis alba]
MSTKHYDSLQLDNSAPSDADLHHNITRCVGDRKSYENHQKQGSHRRECKEDELVRYMSDLPGFLEKGESIHDKVLNVGVLDWACLEQWKCSHKHMPHISSRRSTSTTTNKSVSVSMDRSSGYSSSGRSLSPSCRSICHPPLLSHFMASAMQGHSQDAKSLGKILENCQNISGSNNNTHSQFVGANDCLSPDLPDNRLKARNMKGLDAKIDMKRGALSSDQMNEVASYIMLQTSSQGGKLEKRVETFQQSNMVTIEKDVLKKNKPPVLCLSRDISLNDHSVTRDMPTSQGQKSQILSQTSFIENPKELPPEDFSYKKPNSCTLPDEINCSRSEAKGSSSAGAERVKVHTATFSAPLSAKMGISPSKSRQVEKKQPIITMLSARASSQEPAQKVTGEKSRSSSPFRRFSFSTGFASKGSGCKEDALRPYRSSVGNATSSLENMRGCSSSDISGNGKAGETGRSRSSPLRRLLDPLLKPKTVNCHHSTDSSQKDPLLINENCMLANGKSSSLQREKGLIKNHRLGYSTIDKDDSSKSLLRIAWKNGLPMFTFAVDKSSSILAATVKKLGTTEKDGCCCIYTFFTFRDVNKKAGNWIKQAGKGKGPDYIHHVVGQMKVSNPHYLDLTGQNCVDSSPVKELVLYSVKLKQGCDQAPDYQLDDELAAIILKIPKTLVFTNNVHYSSSCDNGQELVHATVVLPSGVHSHPSKGGPSSLIERWKSGGSCDCGGWDMGCELKILQMKTQPIKSHFHPKLVVKIILSFFLQGNGRDRPAFRFVPFKQGIFSVVL